MYKKSKCLRIIRKELEQGKRIAHGLRAAGIRAYTTLERWRRRPMIDRYIKKCLDSSEGKRVAAVEDAFIKTMLEGKASAASYIFYLTNRNPQYWKHNTALVNNVIQNQNTNVKEETVINVADATEKLKRNLSVLKRNGIITD